MCLTPSFFHSFYKEGICAGDASGRLVLRERDDGAALVVIKDNAPTLVGIGFYNVDRWGMDFGSYIRVSPYCDQISKYSNGAVQCR
uniref:Peptidase S1 domain-containing protein n=1 Tax=Steinernema glaseri TaxID=37863 RepID=A0A1I7ZY05_9BILA